MSQWNEVDLAGISAEMELIPEGKYVFELLNGAKYSQWDPNKIEAGAKIAEGEFAGRVVYFSYGNPEKVPAMLGAFKRLEIALAKNAGISIETGQDPTEYLNSVAGAKFISDIKHRTYTNNEGETNTKAELAVFKVKPVPAVV
jgi:hypothetical protein